MGRRHAGIMHPAVLRHTPAASGGIHSPFLSTSARIVSISWSMLPAKPSCRTQDSPSTGSDFSRLSTMEYQTSRSRY